MWKFLTWSSARRGRARADAFDLITDHGPLAYDVARRMARAERLGKYVSASLPHGHWDRVRRELKRIEGRL